MVVKPKVDPTRADQSNQAATAGTGGELSVSSASIDYATPANATPDAPVGGVGDQLFNTNVAATLSGGTELTVIPTEDPENVYRVFKLSPVWSPIVSAFVTNVYAAGYTFKPVIDVERPEAKKKISESLQFKQAMERSNFEHEATLTQEEIDKELNRIATRVANEMQFMRAWFSRSCPGSSPLEALTLLGMDMENQGDGYLEVLRDTVGYPSKIIWAPAWSIRAKPIDPTLIPVRVPIQVTDYTWDSEVQYLRFRQYVQVDTMGNIVARYKEYRDPRVLSRRTGRYYPTLEAMLQAADEYTLAPDGTIMAPTAATELLHFELPNPLSCTYGKPESTGVYPALEGARDLEEDNMTVVTDRKIPQMFLLVAGGRGLSDPDIKAFEDRIEQNNKDGKRSIHIIQARSARTASGSVSPVPTLEIVKTKSEQYQDALGLKYSEHCYEIARRAVRMPRVALGQQDNVQKDEAQQGYRFTESQVYDPRRDIVDNRFNSTLLPDLGIQLTRYKTQSRTPKEPNELAQIINTLMTAGALTPDEGRELASDIFNRDFKDLEGIWSKLPTKLLLAMLQTKNQLVAAALLGSESESDVISKLQQALIAQLQGGNAAEAVDVDSEPPSDDDEDEDEDRQEDGVEEES